MNKNVNVLSKKTCKQSFKITFGIIMVLYFAQWQIKMEGLYIAAVLFLLSLLSFGKKVILNLSYSHEIFLFKYYNLRCF